MTNMRNYNLNFLNFNTSIQQNGTAGAKLQKFP